MEMFEILGQGPRCLRFLRLRILSSGRPDSTPWLCDYRRGARLTPKLKMGLTRAGQKLLEKKLGDEGPVLIPEESSFRLNSMKRSKNSPSPRLVECSEATGSERQTVSIYAHSKSLVESL